MAALLTCSHQLWVLSLSLDERCCAYAFPCTTRKVDLKRITRAEKTPGGKAASKVPPTLQAWTQPIAYSLCL